MTTTERLIKKGIKKFIRKQINIRGSHIGTVRAAFEIHFPSYDFMDWVEFTELEQAKKFAKL